MKKALWARKPMKRTKSALLSRKRPTRRITRKKGGLPSISKLIKACDKCHSQRVRLIDPKDPKKRKYLRCYTCGHKSLNRKLHAGHYLSRYYKAARWHDDNVRPQCFMCNIYKKGDPIVFRQNLIKEIGEARVLAVEALRNAPLKLTREYLESLLTELQI